MTNPDLISKLGQLIGVLQSNSITPFDINVPWFKNPFAGTDDLSTLLTDTDQTAALFDIIDEMLPKVTNQPAEPGGAVTWYYIPNPQDGTPTAACLVAPSKGEKFGTIGLGTVHDTTQDGLSITLYVYQPLLSLAAPAPSTPKTIKPQLLTDFSKVGVQINDSTLLKYNSASAKTVGLEATLNPNSPTFTLSFTGGNQTKLFNTLTALQGDPDYIGLLGNKFLQTSSMNSWLNKVVGKSTTTFGDMLAAAKLLDQSGANNPVYSFDASTLSSLGSGSDVVEKLVNAALNGLSVVKPLIPLKGGGISIVKNGSGVFGINLEIPDIPLKKPSATSQKELLFQLGSWLKGETGSNNWVKNSGVSDAAAGINIYFLNSTSSSLSVVPPTIELVSIGVDYKGVNSKHPLFDIKGVTLQGAETRIYLKTDLSAVEQFGAAIRLDEIGIPLGPPAGSNSSSNPVAGNILSSGSGSPEKTSTASAAVNPTFSIVTSYLGKDKSVPGSKDKFSFQLFDANGNPTDTIWLPLQRTFGPLKCQKIGIGWQESTKDLLLIFDGGIELGGLEVDLIDLSIGFPITNPTDSSAYELGLKGMSLLFKKGDLRIAGGFMESGSGATTEYNGEVIIDAGKFGLGAIGSYGTTANGKTSLFIFGSSTTPLGGPPAFFVEGIAAGFGYNRKLVPPPKNQVASFPLVAAAADPSAVGLSSEGSVKTSDLGTILDTFDSAVPIALGENWLAAGVKFKTFDLVNSNVLLAVMFGKELEILILGTSLVQLPPPPDNADVFASAELELEVTIVPAKGVVTATAVLSPNSYVLTPDCHLFGGFAFYTWFGNNPHAGDFVLSLGGYNSAFVKPAWYPSVKRLGFLWKISSDLDITGDAYFALTPSCVMGGGRLTASFHMGTFLQAWYTTHTDFVMNWKPFTYYLDMGVSIGIRANVPLLFVTLHLTLSIGATIEIWGPSTGGAAHVHLWFASFTIGFGPGRGTVPHTVDWASLAQMLPKSGAYLSSPAPPEEAFAEVAVDDVQSGDRCPGPLIVASHGLIKNDGDTWVVRASDFMFSATSHVPCSSGSMVSQGKTNSKTSTFSPAIGKPTTVNLRPLGVDGASSEFTVTVTNSGSGSGNSVDLSDVDWEFEQVYGDLPDAIFGHSLPPGTTPHPSAKTTNYMIGVVNVTPKSHTLTGPGAIDLKTAFTDIPVIQGFANYPDLPLSTTVEATGDVPIYTPQAFSDMAAIYNSSSPTTAQSNREDLVNAFGDIGLYEGSGGTLSSLATDPQAVFLNAPMID